MARSVVIKVVMVVVVPMVVVVVVVVVMLVPVRRFAVDEITLRTAVQIATAIAHVGLQILF